MGCIPTPSTLCYPINCRNVNEIIKRTVKQSVTSICQRLFFRLLPCIVIELKPLPQFVISTNWLLFGQIGCTCANWGVVGFGVVVFEQSGCIRANWLYFIWAKWLHFGQNGCIWAKWLHLGKMVLFGQSGCVWAVVIVFGQK